MTEEGEGAPRLGVPRPPSLLDALLPVVVLIALIALTIALFGIDATDGPLQVALLLSAAFASLIAFKNGYTSRSGRRRRGRRRDDGDGRDLHPARGRRADRDLEHGRHDPDRRRLRRPAAQPERSSSSPTAAICAIVGMVTGSSWTTAGTLGVAFVGMAKRDGARRRRSRPAPSSAAPTSATR